ncbi:Rieske (2Fe-2S) protein [Bradyrhizobium tunisiense]|uniref:Rieske (2Fe-2S) protein n=1 Tax=Bradyrhizobium tunisiense TaxID=3278709 RepID=UPI0035D8F080
MVRYVVARVEEIAPGTCKIVKVKGREIGVFRVNNEYFALINRCPHQGAELCKGTLVSRVESSGPGDYQLTHQGEMLRCPWHCWEFDIRTGQSWCDPASVHARTYAVDVEPGATLAKGPYKAETVPVDVDHDYVVLNI